MKCRVCGSQASISLRSYNTAYCETHFCSFLEGRVHSTIRKYALISPEDRPIVAVSGGKDSLSLWEMLTKLGFEADGIYVDLGITDYSARSLEKTKQMADRLGRRFYYFPMGRIFRKGIDEMARIIRRTPCSLCGMIKRYSIHRVCVEKNYTVLATGHNLDDEASALLGNFLYWKEDYLWKKNIALDGAQAGMARKVKPLFLCSEREIAAYAILKGIDYIHDECPFSKGANTLLYKQVLNRIEEESAGTKLAFMKGYLKRVAEPAPARPGLSFCRQCGYPTFGESCSFCRILDKFGDQWPLPLNEYVPEASPSSPGTGF